VPWFRTPEGSLWLLVAITFVSSLGIAVMVPLIPLYATSLGATPTELGLLTSVFALANAAGQLIAGVLTDRLGSRIFIQGGTATYAGANALIAAAASATTLIGYRSVAGLGAGVNLVATRLYLTQVVSPAHLAFANGILSAANAVGQVAGPAFGGIVAALADLRMPFLLVAVTSGTALVGALFLPQPEAAAPRAAAGATGATEPARTSPRASVVLLLAQSLLLAGYGGFITTYAPLATQRLGWTTVEVGVVFSVFGLGSIVLGPPLSRVADRTSRRNLSVLGTIPIALFGLTLALEAPRLILYAVTFAAGGGLTVFTAAWFALLAEASPAGRRGRTFGIVTALSQLGTVFGAMVAAAVWQRAGLSAAMVTTSISVSLGGAALLFLPPERRRA
jgi:MFS family permease